jgi:hypothetical protein
MGALIADRDLAILTELRGAGIVTEVLRRRLRVIMELLLRRRAELE